MKFDLHVHSKYSHDGLTKPETMVKVAKKLGIGFAILDHNNTKVWAELKKLSQEESVPVIFGEEIKTTVDGRKAGELAGLFLNEEIKAREYGEVIDEIRQQDGLVLVPHPFDVLRKNFKFLDQERKRIDALEVLNGRSYRTKYNDQALAYALKHNMNKCAGSDSHTPWEIGRAYAESQGNSLEEFRQELMQDRLAIYGRKSPLHTHLWTWMAKFKLMREL